MLDKKYNAEEKEKNGLTIGRKMKYINLKKMTKNKYIQ